MILYAIHKWINNNLIRRIKYYGKINCDLKVKLDILKFM